MAWSEKSGKREASLEVVSQTPTGPPLHIAHTGNKSLTQRPWRHQEPNHKRPFCVFLLTWLSVGWPLLLLSLLSYKKSWYIVLRNASSDIWFASIFSHSSDCLFSSLCILHYPEVSMFDVVSFVYFYYCCLASCVISKSFTVLALTGRSWSMLSSFCMVEGSKSILLHIDTRFPKIIIESTVLSPWSGLGLLVENHLTSHMRASFQGLCNHPLVCLPVFM